MANRNGQHCCPGGRQVNVTGGVNPAQWAMLRRTLAQHELPPAKRRRLLFRILRQGVMPAAKKHQRQQESAAGVKWPGRWKGRKKAKMIRKLPSMMAVQELNAESAKIYIRGNKRVSPGRVAAMQQEGVRANMTAAQAAAGQDGSAPATLRQAKKLLELGYVVNPVSKPRAPSVRDIRASMSMKKAGATIRRMENRRSKTSWTVTVPPREWLAVSDDEFNKILERQIQALNYGGRR
ncbi:TPA: hypothetical protein ACIAIE_001678 [Serratia fonticola]